MEVVFTPGQIMRTDYFSSEDYRDELPWLAVRGREWHVLLPKPCTPLPEGACARPVTDSHEPTGWRWRLELGDWHLPIRPRQISGPPPPLPKPGTRQERLLLLYVRRENHAHRHAERTASPVPSHHATMVLRVVRGRENSKNQNSPLQASHC